MSNTPPARFTKHLWPETPALPCAEKLAFDTQREANAVIHTIVFKYDTPMHSYYCQYCALWHLSSGRDETA